MKSLLFALLLAGSAQAQLSGPIVRDLGNQYFLVQCNLQQLQPDQTVKILRKGVAIGEAKVMRSQAGLCTIQVQSGEARRFDTVFLPPALGVAQPERGPSIPTFYGTASAVAAPAPRSSAPAAQSNFWNTLQTNGRVYNLNTGETLSP